jgi:hypothetical protein
MKKVLSLLVAFVFMQTQTWALSGGPQYPGNTAAVKGTYAGVMIPALAGNSLGLFVIGVPQEGLASGAFAMFNNGNAFYGSIVGIIDPEKLTLNALANAQQNQTRILNNNGTISTLSIPVALAAGSVTAKLKPTVAIGNNQGFRLTGTGLLTTFAIPAGGGTPVQSGVIVVSVDGFQQSQNVTGTVDISALTGNQATPSSAGS